jgi:transcriptional regulator with XRE-family HTH domain
MDEQATTEVETPTGILARRIRALRKRRDWSARELAERVAKLDPASTLNRGTIAKIESGRRGVWHDEVALFAAALGVPPSTLTDTLPSDPWRVRIGVELEVTSYQAWRWETGAEPLPGATPEDERFAAELAAELDLVGRHFDYHGSIAAMRHAVNVAEHGPSGITESQRAQVERLIATSEAHLEAARTGTPVDPREHNEHWRALQEAERRLWGSMLEPSAADDPTRGA